MMMFAPFLVLACALTFAEGQETSSCSLAQDLNNYCDARCNRHDGNTLGVTGPKGRVGKAGPRGPAGDRGPQGIVNYTAIEEMITRTVDEAFQRQWDKAVNETTKNGWTIFQRRQDGTVDFNRVWDEYVNGFGNPHGEFWMGLEKLHILTSSGNYKLRIDLRDWDENSVYGEYSEFSVGPASTNYRLMVSGYSGTAGDSLINPGRSGHIHNGMAFTTKNLDNDLSSGRNCAEFYKGGWWFNSCSSSNLNGVYHRGGKYTGRYTDGIVWYPWKNDWQYSMNFVEIKLRPAQ